MYSLLRVPPPILSAPSMTWTSIPGAGEFDRRRETVGTTAHHYCCCHLRFATRLLKGEPTEITAMAFCEQTIQA